MTLNNLQINSAAITDKGLSEKRPQNEDSYLELRDSGLYAVADGVGGAQAGDVASQMAMEILGEAFINLQEDGDAEERMKAAIEQANSAIYQMSNEIPQLSTMATTIVAVHINGNIATIGHVGDSRLYRLDEKGNLYRETQDHSVVEEEVRAGRMTPEQAVTHPSRNVISRALGADQMVEIDMKTIMFEPNTKFLVCSDGVTRHIADEELRILLTEEEDSFLVCQEIKKICYERGAEDNLTAVIISVEETLEEDFLNTSDAQDDFEQDTIATSRPPLVNSAVFGNTNSNVGELSTQEIEMTEQFAAENDFADDIDQTVEEEEIIFPTRNDINKTDSITISTQQDTADSDEADIAEKDVKSYRVDETAGSGSFVGKVFSGLLWLLVGTVIGATGFYFWSNSGDTNSIQLGQNRTGNAQLLQFEQSRRVADGNPQKFIADNVNPTTAGDHYLLGRAYIAVGNFDSAKKELEKAKNLLQDTDEINRKVIENDISFAMDKINIGDNETEMNSNTNSNGVGTNVVTEPTILPETKTVPAESNNDN